MIFGVDYSHDKILRRTSVDGKRRSILISDFAKLNRVDCIFCCNVLRAERFDKLFLQTGKAKRSEILKNFLIART